MSVLNAARPHTSISDSPYVYTTARWNTGWEDQFAAVVHDRIGMLQRVARRILHSDDLADDAVQEALFRLWREGQMPPNPEGWLIRAVVLRSLHLYRSRRRRRDYEERAGAQRTEHDPRGDAARALEVKEAAQAIALALGRLPEHLRAVFILRTVEENDYAAIARRLRIPLGTVRSRLNRSRRAISVLLRPLHEEDDRENRYAQPCVY
jgi:RNA polymerase sigma-70 factor (ECF subfamily)